MNNDLTISPQLLLPTLADIDALETKLLDLPQVDLPITNRFSPGVYWREMFVPAGDSGVFVIGHKHKTKHLNVLLEGEMWVLRNGKVEKLTAPQVFESEAGTRKVAFVTKDMRFANIFPLAGLEHCGEDVTLLEEALCEKSAAYLAYEARKLLTAGGSK